MSVVTEDRRATASPPLRTGTLPRWAPAVVLAVAVVVAAVVPTVLGSFSWVWFAVLTALLYGVGIFVASRRVEGRRKAKDRVVTTLVTSAFALALFPLVSLLWTVVENGAPGLTAEFLTSDMFGVIGAGGGAKHAIIGTLLITAAATVISVPIGILAAIYLVEYGRGALARAITFLVDVMTGIPSIVAGLFAFAMFAIFFGPQIRFGFGGAVALSILMIPIVVRSTEEMLRLVPNELREASYALGVPKWRTIVKVVLPTAAAGIGTGVTIAIARIIGETAPLLIIAGFTPATNWNLFSERMMTLPVYAYSQYATPSIPREASIERAWAAVLVLVLIVMVLNLIARLISRLFAPQARR